MLQVNKAAALNEAADRFMYELDSVKISAEYLKIHLQYCCILLITLCWI